jgi:hypothetical protein
MLSIAFYDDHHQRFRSNDERRLVSRGVVYEGW